MSTFHAPNVVLPEASPEDLRIGRLLGRGVVDPRATRAVLVGFPSDEGVRRNGGRPGAAQAPDAIRQMLYRMTPDARTHDAFVEVVERTVDLGNLSPAGTMEEHQARLGEVVGPYLPQGVVPIVLGGGHETTYGHFLGYVHDACPVAILNWDAHADVRPLKDGQGHSGSPFRQALEHPTGLCTGYMVAGLLPHSTARAHLDFLQGHMGRYFWHEDVTPGLINVLYAQDADAMLVSFDLDAVDQQAAPGVSAPAVAGLNPALWFKAAYEAGRCPRVSSVDIVEYNPALDVDGRTARLAALTVWHFLRGLAERQA